MDETEIRDRSSRVPVIEPGHTFATITDKISSIVLTEPTLKRLAGGFWCSVS